MNPSTALATVLVDELVRCGVGEAVLCPGSRSAPLAYALQDADRAGRLRLHVRVDERSAGFLALGLAKTSGVPAAVVTTSGTAVPNVHPAVLEASHAGVPLIVISADRPPELRGTGANQTTDQIGIFGAALRWSADLGTPDARPGQVASWRTAVCRAIAAAGGVRGETAGPVQLNVPLREPLVPEGDTEWVERLDGRPDGGPWVRIDTAEPTVTSLEAEPRTVVVIGDLPTAMQAQAAEIAAVGWPVIGEPFGRVDRGLLLPHGPLLLGADEWLNEHLPERVLLVGRVTLSRAVAKLLRSSEVRVEVIAPAGQWPDPSHVVSRVYPTGRFTSQDVSAPAVDLAWASEWRAAGERVRRLVEPAIAASWPSGVAVAQTVIGRLPMGSTLFVGSSNPARDLDLAMSPAAADGVRVLANRGLAGIDGCVSTAVGIALSSRPRAVTYALVGDLTFLHDANALLIGPGEPRPDLSIVVVNDDGGGIFATLEPGEPSRAADFERVFGTPTGASIRGLCEAYGVEHLLAGSAAELADAIATNPNGIRVIEVRVDRSGHRMLRARLAELAEAACAERDG